MAKSDAEEQCDDKYLTKMVRYSVHSPLEKGNDNTIHSGHFMLSSVHDDESEQLISSANSKPQTNRNVQNAVCDQKSFIDSSLVKLFECLTLAYRGKLTSPKWKNFNGVQLNTAMKVRLNNVIWREWHNQYIHGKKPLICTFENPITDRTHMKAEAVVLEGKYWKRRLESVASEYKKCRMYYKEKFSKKSHSEKTFMEEVMSHAEELERVGLVHTASASSSGALDTSSIAYMNEDYSFGDYNFITDNLLSFFGQPFPFPTNKEYLGSQLGNSDFMQPGLSTLLPGLEDESMDTLEPLPSVPGLTPYYNNITSNLPMEQTQGNQFLSQQCSAGMNSSSAADMIISPSSDAMDALYQYLASSNTISNGVPDNNIDSNLLLSLSAAQNDPARNIMDQFVYGGDGIVALGDELNITGYDQHELDTFGSLLEQQQTLNSVSHIQEMLSKQMFGNQSNCFPYCGDNNLMMSLNQNSARGFQDEATKPRVSSANNSQLGKLEQRNNHLVNLLNSPLDMQQPLAVGQSSSSKLILSQPRPSAQQVQITSSHVQLASPLVQAPKKSREMSQLLSLLQPSTSTTSVKSQPLMSTISSHKTAKSKMRHASGSKLLQQNVNAHDKVSTGSGRRASTGSVAPHLLPARMMAVNRQKNEEGAFIKPQVADIPKVNKTRPSPTIDPDSHGRGQQVLVKPSALAATVLSPSQPSQITYAWVSSPSQAQAAYSTQNLSLAQLLMQGTNTTPAAIGNTTPVAVTNQLVFLPSRTPVSSMTLGSTSSAVVASNNIVAVPDPVVSSASGLNNNMNFNLSSQFDDGKDRTKSSLSHNLSACYQDSSVLSPSAKFSDQLMDRLSFISPPPSVKSRHSSGESLNTLRDNPDSPLRIWKSKGSDSKHTQYTEQRRASHLSAEKKRRCNIKYGFEMLNQLVPSLNQNSNVKISKAATLSRAVEFVKKLKQEKTQLTNEIELLQREVEALSADICQCQSQLPATGAPVTRQRADRLREMCDDYVKNRVNSDWKFWIFSLLVWPLFETYCTMVSTASVDDLWRTIFSWLDQHCSLVSLRPMVLNALLQLSATTSILSNPSLLPQEASRAIARKPLVPPGNKS